MRLFLEIFLLFDYDRDSITEDVEVAMDIQHLKYFVEVVRQESFTRAAAQLFVTQPMPVSYTHLTLPTILLV